MADNWVIVRVWLSKDRDGVFCVAHTASKVGHVSLETKMGYYSFWPENTPMKQMKQGAVFGLIKGRFHSATEEDEKEYGHPPEVVVVLFTLETDRIHKEFENFKSSNGGGNWSLLGRNVFNIFNKGGGQSCSGLAYDLLNAGGITTLVEWDFISNLWTVAPDAVARVAVKAANTEAEVSASSKCTLPLGISERVVKPNCDLNPHSWKTGHYLGQPKQSKVAENDYKGKLHMTSGWITTINDGQWIE